MASETTCATVSWRSWPQWVRNLMPPTVRRREDGTFTLTAPAYILMALLGITTGSGGAVLTDVMGVRAAHADKERARIEKQLHDRISDCQQRVDQQYNQLFTMLANLSARIDRVLDDHRGK